MLDLREKQRHKEPEGAWGSAGVWQHQSCSANQTLPLAMSSWRVCPESGRFTSISPTFVLIRPMGTLILKTGDVDSHLLTAAQAAWGVTQPHLRALEPPVRLKGGLENRMLMQLLHPALLSGSSGPPGSTRAAHHSCQLHGAFEPRLERAGSSLIKHSAAALQHDLNSDWI